MARKKEAPPSHILSCRIFSPVNGERDELPLGLKKASTRANVPPSLRALARTVAGMQGDGLREAEIAAVPRQAPGTAVEVKPGTMRMAAPLLAEEAGAFVLLLPIGKMTCDHGDGPGPCVQYRVAVFDAPRLNPKS